jgi:probable HAF family extracellular repeat protein
MKNHIALVFAAISLFMSVPAIAVVQYTVTDLGALGGSWSQAQGINASGQVVGESCTNGYDNYRAFLYSGSTMTDLGTFGGPESRANGINFVGQVVGWASNSAAYADYHAFLYSGSTMTDLGTLGGTSSVARGINICGKVVGWASTPGDFASHAFLYSDSTMTDLGTLGGSHSDAYAINSLGQVVGEAHTTSNAYHAFLYSGSTMTDLGTLGGSWSRAYGINDLGQVVGEAYTSTARHAFLYSGSTMTDLGALGGSWSRAYGINNLEQVVGEVKIADNAPTHAFLYQDSTMIDLNTLIDPSSGWRLASATAINDLGQICGRGYGPAGTHAFLLTPIPEPSTLALLGIGGFGLIACGWWRRKHTVRLMALIVVASVAGVGIVQADVFNMVSGQNSLEFVTVGDPGNAADTLKMDDQTTGYGSVDHIYSISKFEVTNAQWREFLAAKATLGDPHGLYNSNMAGINGGIDRSGDGTSTNPFVYSSKGNDAAWDNRPVNYISFWDAARYCNWLQNGQGDGDTEWGAYANIGDQASFSRQPGARYFIPTENEWYKAAYYKGGGRDAGYWLYPTKSNEQPSNVLSVTGTNNANYLGTNVATGVTTVGSFAASPGPYGTFDQAGNLWEYNEDIIRDSRRVARGGCWTAIPTTLQASNRSSGFAVPTYESKIEGFRIASVPEPATLALMLTVSLGGLLWWRRKRAIVLTALFVSVCSVETTQADVFNLGGTRNADGTWSGLASLETVPVGNINNAADARTGFGSVDHVYNIGKYEVTAGQYCEFLNAKAKTDTYGLYNFGMWSSSVGCKIQRTGNSGSYAYSVAADYANRPVNYVSFWAAARFTNWLCNGQGSGDTETGAYTLGGYNGNDGRSIIKNVGAPWWIPSENEWYKAAYNNGASATTDYYLYPTSSDVVPSNVLDTPADLGNNATFYNNGYTIDSPYYRTEVGAHENSDSPYGTFDQGGNVWEWYDPVNYSSLHGVRGGGFKNISYGLASSNFSNSSPTGVSDVIGFRIAGVPEPSTLALLGMGGFGLIAVAWRRKEKARLLAVLVVALVACVGTAQADVRNMGGTRNVDGTWSGLASLETVPVSNVNNAADASTAFGSVDHAYNIGKYEVTAGQYCEFLNAKAKSDPYGLYNTNMWSSSWGCKISQSGLSGSYAYSVAADRANRPVNYVCFWDAARFTNWLCNGQGVDGDTETGAYPLTPAGISDNTITKNAGASWWIPSENEWYKAAYNNGGSAATDYFLYPTASNLTPINELGNPTDPGNNATFFKYSYTTGTPNYPTEVGAHENSDSYYGTFDQGGDVCEWNDSTVSSLGRGLRGGSFLNQANDMASVSRYSYLPTLEYGQIGFRVASVPEPSTIALLLAASLGGLLWWRRKRAIVLTALFAIVCGAGTAQADVFNMGGTRDSATETWSGLASLEFVTVGDAGNAADSSARGAVGYVYGMGKYDVTVGQYCEFLNAVAKTDTYGLYHTEMASQFSTIKITQSGTAGQYQYSVAGSYSQAANCPVFHVSWGDAARFCNWLQNGQPSFPEGTPGEVAGATETGAYTLSGAVTRADLMAVARNADALYAIPTEKEWFKAAYYKAGGLNAGYWHYPTRSDVVPSNVLSPAGTNNANFYSGGFTDPVNALTPVGAFAGSPGPYGTFDMGGDVFQWTEGTYSGTSRGLHGGSFGDQSNTLLYSSEYFRSPTEVNTIIAGFRVVSIPEPSTLALLLAASLGGLLWWRRKRALVSATLFAIVCIAGTAQGDVFNMGGTRDPATGTWTGSASLEFVPVGDAGNAPDTAVMNDGTTGHGSVPYAYQMGKYDVTIGQYCQFLNAVAKRDTYGLYSTYMAAGAYYPTAGISRSVGSMGNYTYAVAGSNAQAANCPIMWITWGNAARFCNWLSNGQPTGAEGNGTTETGSYTLYGAVTRSALMAITRNAGATYFIPTEDEWYKAAYYKGRGTDAGYWAYPTQSNTAPINILSATGTNNANFYDSDGTGTGGRTDQPNLLTPVGAFSASPGPYGTYDMGGNVWQWNESHIYEGRGMAGGSWNYSSISFASTTRCIAAPPSERGDQYGFRVACVPEPPTIVLLLAASLAGLLWWRRG